MSEEQESFTEGSNIVEEKNSPELLTPKQEWAKQMRLKFTPKKMLNDDGHLKEEYFRPTRTTKVTIRKWGEKEREGLIKGIEKYGVGAWTKICGEFLPEWKPTDVSVKAKRLIGSQSIAPYKGWKPNEKEILDEYESNKEIGLRFGCWRGGVLVSDDKGLVEEARGKKRKTIVT